MSEPLRGPVASVTATGKGVYLYCFARAGMQPEIPVVDLEGAGTVSWVEEGGVAAVCSFVAIGDFTGESGESHLQDPSWVVPRACRHEEVIEMVMDASPVFPVRFGAVFSSRRALARALAEDAAHISSFLDSVAGKEEWSVKCCVDVAKAAEGLLESDPALAKRREALPSQPGARYFEEKRLMGDALRVARRLCASAGEEVATELEKLPVDWRVMRLPPPGASGSTGEVALKRAFLIDRRAVTEFRWQVDEIASKFADRGVSLDLTGPWPPYSFCTPLGKTDA